MNNSSPLKCPSCSGPLRPAVMACDPCGLRVEGKFAQNEFATLGEEQLHLLRIFVHTEGRIREMESALGLSYPTIKQRLADLRRVLAPQAESAVVKSTPPTPSEPPAPQPAREASVSEVLSAMEAGRLTFEDAMAQIRRLKGEGAR
ncbi:MAG: DUF2089 family protein [Planctomycetota bacterium]